MEPTERKDCPPPPLPPRRPRNSLELQNSRERSPSDGELNARFEEIRQHSGVLAIAGMLFTGVRIDDLEMKAHLGAGACGTVTKRLLRKYTMAVKEMKVTDNYQESKRIYMDLAVISKSRDCPHIVQCFGFILTSDHLFICMEMMATCLERLLYNKFPEGFPEEIIGKITLGVVSALHYLKEKHSIMHRDVKPSNILLDWYGNVKLGDFGIAGQLIDSKAATMTAGSIAYLAPERIDPVPYGVRSDVWSLGITLFHLATGKLPYDVNRMGTFELMAHIKQEDPPRFDDEQFSAEFRDFVGYCLQKDFARRPNYRQLMLHCFLRNAGQQDVDVALWFTRPEDYAAINNNCVC